jgi:hypothetical protein
MLLATDANGLPLGMLTMSAGVGKVRMAEATLATISVPPEEGKAEIPPPPTDRGQGVRQPQVPSGVTPARHPPLHPAEAATEELETPSRPSGQGVHGGISPPLASGARRPRGSFAWLGHQRRLLVRHEHRVENFHAFYIVACTRIALASRLR